MSIEVWIAFVVASTVLLAVPGPTVLILVSYALGHGRQSAWATVPGVALGDFTAMTASLLGAGAVLATSATLFTALKLVGAAYLVWLGISLWRADPKLGRIEAMSDRANHRAMFWNTYVITALNPKSIVFFVAFVPQFVNPAEAALPQFVILEATFLFLAALAAVVWALLAGGMRERFQRQETLRMVNRTGAGFLIGAGVLTAVTQRP